MKKSSHVYYIALTLTILCSIVIVLLVKDDTRAMTNREIFIDASITEAKQWESLSNQVFNIIYVQGVIVDDVAYVRYAYELITSSNEAYEHVGIMKINLDLGILFSYREVDRPIVTLNSYFTEFDSAMEDEFYDFHLDEDDILDFISKVKPNRRITK